MPLHELLNVAQGVSNKAIALDKVGYLNRWYAIHEAIVKYGKAKPRKLDEYCEKLNNAARSVSFQHRNMANAGSSLQAIRYSSND